MNLALKPIVLAMLVAATEVAGVACAQATNVPEASVARAAPQIPVSNDPQRHFTDAVAAYAKKDYKAAAADIRQATDDLRAEAGRASGAARQELDSSIAELDRLAVSVQKGAVKDEQTLANDFAKAERALALAHRSKAAEGWTRKEYHKAGHELQRAANALERAAAWAGGEAEASVSATVADTRALSDKLASDATWTRDEVAKAFQSLDRSLNALGEKIDSLQKA